MKQAKNNSFCCVPVSRKCADRYKDRAQKIAVLIISAVFWARCAHSNTPRVFPNTESLGTLERAESQAQAHSGAACITHPFTPGTKEKRRKKKGEEKIKKKKKERGRKKGEKKKKKMKKKITKSKPGVSPGTISSLNRHKTPGQKHPIAAGMVARQGLWPQLPSPWCRACLPKPTHA